MYYAIMNKKDKNAYTRANNKYEALQQLSEANGREIKWIEVRRVNCAQLLEIMK